VFPKHFFDLVPIEGSALSPRTTLIKENSIYQISFVQKFV